MADVKQAETSLLTEHLRYTPLAIIDDIINTVNLLIERAVDAVESGLLSSDPDVLGFAARAAAENRIPPPSTADDGQPEYPEMLAEIEEGVHQLETLLATNVDRNFDKFELYALRNVFAIDAELVPWVRLGHHEGVELRAVGAPDAPSLDSVRLARRKLQETRKLNGALRAERARNERLLRQLRAVAGAQQPVKAEPEAEQQEGPSGQSVDFSFLASTPAAQALGMRQLSPDGSAASQPGSTPLTTNTSFTLAQLPSLKALLDELRPKISALQNIDPSQAQGRFARERSEYVETQTMRILERRGVDLDEPGAYNAAVSAGRRIGKDEVEALERIVSVMGGKPVRRPEDLRQAGGGASDEDAMEE